LPVLAIRIQARVQLPRTIAIHKLPVNARAWPRKLRIIAEPLVENRSGNGNRILSSDLSTTQISPVDFRPNALIERLG
jgi:hypothetical protein